MVGELLAGDDHPAGAGHRPLRRTGAVPASAVMRPTPWLRRRSVPPRRGRSVAVDAVTRLTCSMPIPLSRAVPRSSVPPHAPEPDRPIRSRPPSAHRPGPPRCRPRRASDWRPSRAVPAVAASPASVTPCTPWSTDVTPSTAASTARTRSFIGGGARRRSRFGSFRSRSAPRARGAFPGRSSRPDGKDADPVADRLDLVQQVATRGVPPSLAHLTRRRSRSRISTTPSGSMAVVGSSRMRMSGSLTSASAMPSRWSMPRE